MALQDDLLAIDASETLSESEKRQEKYRVKSLALLDVILNGKPAPNPIPPLLNRTFTLNGTSIRVNSAEVTSTNALFLNVTFNSTVTHTIVIVNPPVLPSVRTGNEKQDLITAASELLDGFV